MKMTIEFNEQPIVRASRPQPAPMASPVAYSQKKLVLLITIIVSSLLGSMIYLYLKLATPIGSEPTVRREITEIGPE
jgi:hypothetical protein